MRTESNREISAEFRRFRILSGEAIFLLRSGDTILPGKIRTILDFIERNPSFGYGRFSFPKRSSGRAVED